MPGTLEGGSKTADTNKKKYGADYYVKLGKLGGKAGTGHKFGHGKVDPHEAGRKGGKATKKDYHK
jgi:general stress protein YciG